MNTRKIMDTNVFHTINAATVQSSLMALASSTSDSAKACSTQKKASALASSTSAARTPILLHQNPRNPFTSLNVAEGTTEDSRQESKDSPTESLNLANGRTWLHYLG